MIECAAQLLKPVQHPWWNSCCRMNQYLINKPFLFALIIVSLPTLRADEPAVERRYDAGPLQVEDFQAAVPDPRPKLGRLKQLAFADTDVRFQMQYRYENKSDGVEAALKDIDIYAVFLTDKSWIAPEGEKTLDHEQGHFDITQMYALDAKLQMKNRLQDGKTLIGRGDSVSEAVADLQAKVGEFLEPLRDRIGTAQKEYDRGTNHGTLAAPQAAHRKRQLQVLKELITDLEALDEAD